MADVEKDEAAESESFETEDEAEDGAHKGKGVPPMSPSKLLLAKQERERLRRMKKERQEALDKYRNQMNTEAMKDEKTRARDRMRYLLQQADIFQHFMQVDKSGAKGPAALKKGGKGSGAASARGRKREEDEDKELLQDEMEDADAAPGHFQAHRLQVQPACIKFGTMRDYQLQGLNWMIHLYVPSLPLHE